MIEWGSPEWHEARIGQCTASRISDVLARTKTGWGASRKNYRAELVAERLTGREAEHFISAAMRWGTDTEPAARAAYEFFYDREVTECGYVVHPSIANAGGTPDGLVGDDGMIEIKCPLTATHLETLQGGEIPGDHVSQMIFQMACTGRQWVDWISFDPRLPDDQPELQMIVRRIHRDAGTINLCEQVVIKFIQEVDEIVNKLRPRPAAPVEADEVIILGAA